MTSFDDVPPPANVVCDATDLLTSPVERIEYLRSLRDAADAWLGEYVQAARKEGMAWQSIADALGVSRQAAHAKYAGDEHGSMPWMRIHLS